MPTFETSTKEVKASPSYWVLPGFPILGVGVVFFLVFAFASMALIRNPSVYIAMIALFIFMIVFFAKGFFILQPNTGVAHVFFGTYAGSWKKEGFWYTNPFYTAEKVSTKVINTSSEKIKVNDASGSPVDVECVISWRVSDLQKALLEVEDFEDYVHTQMEVALRNVVSHYPYEPVDGGKSLRNNKEEVSDEIQAELQKQCNIAGVRVLDAQLSHLAYSSEIAQAMLRRQQSFAVVQARTVLVKGAVDMVKDAINQMQASDDFQFTAQEKARLAINMMTALVSESGAQTVIPLE